MKTSRIMLIPIFALLAAAGVAPGAGETTAFLERVHDAPSRVEEVGGKVLDAGRVKVVRTWQGELCRAAITNVSQQAVRLGNIILFDLAEHRLDPATPVYGEGFQMVAQNSGTLGQLTWRGPYPDATHYKIPEPDGIPTAYGMMTLDLGKAGHVLLGFTSCRRFCGRFSFDAKQLRISLDPEGLELAPGETWQLEEFIATAGPDRNALLDKLTAAITRNHPPLPQPPLDKRAGWCTWYGVGGSGNEQIVKDAAKFFAEKLPEVKFIQIDEGYTLEGNLADVDPGFGDMTATAAATKACGLLPAIWVGPFVAAQKSHVLADHPDWFVQGANGQPLVSSTIGFGGWKNPPWCSLDGSNPAAAKYLEGVFEMMRRQYGFTYFKLDANYWGTIHGGKHFDPKATRVEAYRRGMEAVVRGAGRGAVILGCNAPLWPSLGLVNAMRTGNDLNRSFGSFQSAARENLARGWQNGKLWVLDPDCVLLAGDYEGKPGAKIPPNILYLHATVVHAAGGLVISGDRIPDLGPEQMAILRKLLPPTGKTARFESMQFECGSSAVGDVQYHYAFNWGEVPADRTLHLQQRSRLRDFWTDEDLGIQAGDFVLTAIPARSARLIVATRAGN